jgi:hypothetical protein
MVELVTEAICPELGQKQSAKQIARQAPKPFVDHQNGARAHSCRFNSIPFRPGDWQLGVLPLTFPKLGPTVL